MLRQKSLTIRIHCASRMIFLSGIFSCLFRDMQQMSHPGLLCLQIPPVMAAGFNFNRYPVRDLCSVQFQPTDFIRVVGHEFNALYPKKPEYLGSSKVVSFIRLKPQMKIGVQGIQPLLLQFIGVELVQQANSSSFLARVQQDTFAFFLNGFQCPGELLTAVTAAGTEDISGKAFGMNPAKNIFLSLNISFCQLDGFTAVAQA